MTSYRTQTRDSEIQNEEAKDLCNSLQGVKVMNDCQLKLAMIHSCPHCPVESLPTRRRKRKCRAFLPLACLILLKCPKSSNAFLISNRQSALYTTSALHSTRVGRTFPQRKSPAEARQLHNHQQQNSKTKPKRVKMEPMPVTGYDAYSIEEYYDRRPLEVIWRLNSLGFPLLFWYLRLLLDKALGKEDSETQRQQGEALRNLLVQSKSVALIKSGQAISLRPDLIRNEIWSNELGKLVDAVGSFSDEQAMKIMSKELSDVRTRLDVSRSSWEKRFLARKRKVKERGLKRLVASDPVLSLFGFMNDNKAVASASIGQVYKARIIPGPQLVAAIGEEQAKRWGGKVVAIKVQRPDAQDSASLDMYLLRRTAEWLDRFRGGDLPLVADAFGMQLFGELDYVREANNCERFGALYGGWDDVLVPIACTALTRRKVLVMEWVDGEKGPWKGQQGIDMVRIGLRCCVDQLMASGVQHSDPHRGNLLRTPDGKLAFIDFGMISDISPEDRYGLFGLVIGLQNKDLPLITENLLALGFLKDTAQLDEIVPRLRKALLNATGGTGRASDVNFTRLQAELDSISRENILRFSTPPFFTVIIRSLTILEGFALSVDPKFKLVRGAYPYVLNQLLDPEDGQVPDALQKLLVRLLTIDGEEKEIDWETLRSFLLLAQKASKTYDPNAIESGEDKSSLSRQTITMFAKFLTGPTGIFLKRPLVHELAESIDGMASIGEGNLQKWSRGLLPKLPGMEGPVNERRMDELRILLDTFRDALIVDGEEGTPRMEAMMDLFRDFAAVLQDERVDTSPLVDELRSVAQMVAVEVLEIRGSRAINDFFRR